MAVCKGCAPDSLKPPKLLFRQSPFTPSRRFEVAYNSRPGELAQAFPDARNPSSQPLLTVFARMSGQVDPTSVTYRFASLDEHTRAVIRGNWVMRH